MKKKLFVIDDKKFFEGKKIWLNIKLNSKEIDNNNLSDSKFIRDLINSFIINKKIFK